MSPLTDNTPPCDGFRSRFSQNHGEHTQQNGDFGNIASRYFNIIDESLGGYTVPVVGKNIFEIRPTRCVISCVLRYAVTVLT